MKKTLYLLATLVLMTTNLIAQRTVRTVSVKSTNEQQISQSLVLNHIRLQPGKSFSPVVLSEDIKRLFKTNLFSDVQTKTEVISASQVDLLFILTRKSMVESFSFVGNKIVSDKKLRARLEHGTDVLLDDKQLAKDKSALLELYKDKGFNEINIFTKFGEGQKDGTITVTYVIKESARLKTDKVYFKGNEFFTQGELRSSIGTSPSFWRHYFNSGHFNQFAFDQDLKTLTQKYLDKGFLDFKVANVERKLNGEYLVLTIHIQEGARYKFNQIDISGNQLFSKEELLKDVRAKSGEFFDEETKKADTKRLSARYNNKGYLDSQIRPRLNVDRNAHLVSMNFRIAEGKESHIRDIYFYGNQITKDHVIRRELAIQPTDLSNQLLIDKSKGRLKNLGYFESVEMIPVDTEEEGLKDLQVKLKEAKTGKLQLGAGVSSLDSFIGTLELGQSNFDLYNGWPFVGGGQRFKARISAGSVRNEYGVSWIEPWFLDKQQRFSVDAYKRTRIYDRFEQSNTGLSLGLTKRLEKNKRWSYKYGVKAEQVDLGDFDLNVSNELLSEKGDDFITALTFSLIRDTRNSFRRANNGSRFSFDTELQSESLGSDNDLYKLSLKGAKYIGLFDDSVLKISGQYSTVEDLQGDIPIYERYFAGGLNSFRGYKFRNVSPVDSNNDEIGGQSMILGTVELDIPLYKNVNWAVFSDFGTVFTDSYELSPNDISASIGVGLRLNLPIGPLVFDFAKPFRDNEANGGSGRLHFNLGYSF